MAVEVVVIKVVAVEVVAVEVVAVVVVAVVIVVIKRGAMVTWRNSICSMIHPKNRQMKP